MPVVVSDGRQTTGAEAHRKVNRDRAELIAIGKRKGVWRAIVLLSRASDLSEEKMERFLDYYTDEDAFTPNQMAFLIWQFEKHKIPFDPGDFRVRLRRDREKDQVRRMEPWKFEKLKQCLSPAQVRACLRHRKT